jgi:hypothetical protein
MPNSQSLKIKHFAHSVLLPCVAFPHPQERITGKNYNLSGRSKKGSRVKLAYRVWLHPMTPFARNASIW